MLTCSCISTSMKTNGKGLSSAWLHKSIPQIQAGLVLGHAWWLSLAVVDDKPSCCSLWPSGCQVSTSLAGSRPLRDDSSQSPILPIQVAKPSGGQPSREAMLIGPLERDGCPHFCSFLASLFFDSSFSFSVCVCVLCWRPLSKSLSLYSVN